MNPKMPNEYQIVETMIDYYEADMRKHAMTIEIMLKNPMAFHDHDKFYEAIESQLRELIESKDYIEGLRYVKDVMEEYDEE